jgi:hypothetical protein
MILRVLRVLWLLGGCEWLLAGRDQNLSASPLAMSLISPVPHPPPFGQGDFKNRP